MKPQRFDAILSAETGFSAFAFRSGASRSIAPRRPAFRALPNPPAGSFRTAFPHPFYAAATDAGRSAADADRRRPWAAPQAEADRIRPSHSEPTLIIINYNHLKINAYD